MFKFINRENVETKVTEDYIVKLENDLKIKFPKILKSYYLKHNGAEIEPCKLSFRINLTLYECCVKEILTLKFGEYNFEYEVENIKNNKHIPNEFIPLALNDDEDIFCWNTCDDKVYYVKRDEQNPILICENVEKFFEILEICVKNKDIYNLGECTYLEYNSSIPIGATSINESEDKIIQIEEILKFNNKNKVLIILLIFTLSSLIFIPFTDSLSLIVTAGLGIYTLIVYFMHITNRIKSINAIKKYGYDELKKELLSKNTIKIDGIGTYLTDNYIISNNRRIVVTKYSDIVWIYPTRIRGLYNSNDYIKTHLKNGRFSISAITTNDLQMRNIFDRIYQKNKEILFGYTNENLTKYKKVCPNYSRKKVFEIIFVILISIIALLISR